MKISKEIKETLTIEICSHDVDRCSRDCRFCQKSMGNYRCYLRSNIRCGEYEDIEFGEKEDIDSPDIPTAESYGFTRTEYCKRTFGNLEGK